MGGVCYKGCGSHSFFIHDHIYKFSRKQCCYYYSTNIINLYMHVSFSMSLFVYGVFTWCAITIVCDNAFDN
jgi:hypothetical protein